MAHAHRTLALLALAAALLPPAAAQTREPQPAPVAADAGGPVTPADIMALRDMRDVEISPDGRTILFTVQAQMATFTPDQRTIWSVPADGSAPARRFITSAGADDSPRWSPDGRAIAFVSDRKNPLAGTAPTGLTFTSDLDPADRAPVAPRQLWRIARDGGEAVPLTALPGDIGAFAWSPDGTRIAFLSADPDTAAERADAAAKRDWVEMDRTRHVTRLWLLDLATNSARRISPASVNVTDFSWSPDGKRMAVRLVDTTTINDYLYFGRIALLDLATGTIGKTLIEHATEAPIWSPDGTALVGEVIRTPGFIGLGVRLYDVGADRLTALADDHPGLLTHLRWAPDGRSILALSFEQTRSKLVRIARDGRVTRLADLDGEASDLTLSRDGRGIAVALSSPDRPAEVWAIDGTRARPVTTINPQVAGWKLGQVRQLSWTNSKDGRPVYGVLVTPPGHVAGTPIKTVVQIHGGPEWAWWSGWLGSWHEWAQMLATHGYAVLLPNPRGSDGQGTDFARAIGNDWGGMDYQDVLDGVDMLVAQKIADPARLGIGGWSYGGFMAAWAVTQGDRFKAAVVGAAPANMTAMARITDTPEFPTGYFGEPSAHLADLDKVSSIRALDRVHTPVLVLHGEQDTRVPFTLGLEYYRGLKLLGKPVEMVRYPREPHWFREPEHQADIQRRVLAWFDAHL
ncbi:S9 family peptidase [Sphingomonas hengshuiensis]|uniref:S9 family peptidase n=1 Tax=Sphingomonas hengshuiensis TaxID=1609977 RepID=UPI00069885D4|nr:S9 family peptidase [Sphingomonas hengshuiensis]